MRYRFASLALVLVLFSSTPLLAQEISGHYVTTAAKSDTTTLADGSTLVHGQYPQVIFTNSGMGPFGNAQNYCSSWMHMAAGATEAAGSDFAGNCFGLDGDGDVYWLWWRLDQAGTAACSTMCGSWGVYKGTGKYKAMTGGGTWKMTTQFPDGSNRGTFTYKGM